MVIGELCTRKVIIASRNTSISEAAKLMREHHAGDIVVTEESGGNVVPIGIVTDRDMVMEILAQEVSPAGLSVGDVMTEGLVTANSRDGVFETIQLMRTEGIRRAPIVDDTGALIGIVSLDDLVELLAEELGNLASLLRQERRREIEARK
jgi:CBS domain-containing protein